MMFQSRPGRAPEPVPPSIGGEPPMTTEFNRWFLGIIIPAVMAVWSLVIFLQGNFTLVTSLKNPRVHQAKVVLTGYDAYSIALLILMAAILLHRIRFHYRQQEADSSCWKWYDKLLAATFFIPIFYWVYRLICIAIS